jgi:S1/P1 nuclease
MRRVIAYVSMLLMLPSQFFGWGEEGHRVVAAVAQAHLTQIARRNIQSLRGNKSLACIATWADSTGLMFLRCTSKRTPTFLPSELLRSPHKR